MHTFEDFFFSLERFGFDTEDIKILLISSSVWSYNIEKKSLKLIFNKFLLLQKHYNEDQISIYKDKIFFEEEKKTSNTIFCVKKLPGLLVITIIFCFKRMNYFIYLKLKTIYSRNCFNWEYIYVCQNFKRPKDLLAIHPSI